MGMCQGGNNHGHSFIYAGGYAEEADITFSVMIYYMSLRDTNDEIEKGQVGCFGYQTGCLVSPPNNKQEITHRLGYHSGYEHTHTHHQ